MNKILIALLAIFALSTGFVQAKSNQNTAQKENAAAGSPTPAQSR